jgi:hypothetical protein
MISNKGHYLEHYHRFLIRIVIILCGLLPATLAGQQAHTLSGKITDSETGEDLIGVTVVAMDIQKGVATNAYGYFSLTIPEGSYKLLISYVGYLKKEMEVLVNADQTLHIELAPSVLDINEVVISSSKEEAGTKSSSAGIAKIIIKEIKTLPVFFGEKDILKTIQLLPGISSASEGSTGFNVRGGSIGQNLILLDEAPVYSSSHLMGFFSVFNSDAIKDVAVYKSGIPASYGGRVSSVVDISMNNGNSKEFKASGGIGLVSSRLTVEMPILKERLSLIISGRRTYADIVARLLFPGKLVSDDMDFYFYDLNAKLNYTINGKNRLFFSGYFGNDVFELGRDVGTGWGNRTATIRWNHIYSGTVFSNTSLIYSKYDYGFIFGHNSLRLRSGIEDFSFKEDLTWYLNPENTLKAGLNIILHKFSPGELKTGENDDFEIVQGEKGAVEGSLYIQNDQSLTSRLSANYGLRFSSFHQTGPGWFFTYNDANEPVDSVFYKRGEIAFPRMGIEPRLSINYQTGDRTSVKMSYNRMIQYLHLLSNSNAGSPTDVWMPSSNNLKPLAVDHISTGLFMSFLNNSVETSAEIYYKNNRNTTDYEDGAEILFNEYTESQILSGRGRSYGLELYIKKRVGRFTGWISYTIARTENKIKGVNNSSWYPVRYDKTHDLSIISSYKLGQRVTLSGVWIYATGNAVTFPSGKYSISNYPVPYYTARNGYRMPHYHRLDLSLSVEGKSTKKFISGWEFSVYNLYNRHNAYMITFRESDVTPGTTEAVKLSLFGIVPSISYNFRF